MAQPYWVDRQKPLSKEDLAHLKTLPEDSENQVNTDHIPVKPKGGELYLYDTKVDSKKGKVIYFNSISNSLVFSSLYPSFLYSYK